MDDIFPIIRERKWISKEYAKEMFPDKNEPSMIDFNGQICAPPDDSNIYYKRQFTFLIEGFLKYAMESAECSLCEQQYDELMELWEKW